MSSNVFYILEETMESISDILGIIGVALVLITYLLLQLEKMSANALLYSLGNFIGAILILISLWYHWNLASVIIEIAWLLISGYGLYKIFLKSKIR